MKAKLDSDCVVAALELVSSKKVIDKSLYQKISAGNWERLPEIELKHFETGVLFPCCDSKHWWMILAKDGKLYGFNSMKKWNKLMKQSMELIQKYMESLTGMEMEMILVQCPEQSDSVSCAWHVIKYAIALEDEKEQQSILSSKKIFFENEEIELVKKTINEAINKGV